ncbi:MAG: cytochrome P450 [Novosphingobium sp.]|nr:cytochrome P450 [Novosphingobium sp.]MCP5400897.1 cytochrome P450 [Novosphingobium sp.]
MTITREEELWLLDPAQYHARGYPWDAWAKLRRDDPVHRIEQGFGGDFWAVTRHADIVACETNPDVFKNGPALTIGAETGGFRMLVNLDPPEHPQHRAVANPWFMPRSIEWVRQLAEEIVTETFDRAMERNGEVIDFQEDVANLVPTAVISAYLGAPREMWPKIVEWTNQIINANDPSVAGDQGTAALLMQATGAIMQVHGATFADRRANPKDDLMTALVQAEIDGKPLTDIELASWGIILTTAGHETSQSTFGMGVHTLLQHPDQLARLKADPSLLPRAIDEMLRYLSPAIHFLRTPDRDVEVGGKTIRAGEHMIMFYPSANRDEEVFENPDSFDIERNPNRHLAFGCGPHVCIGMHLAKLELRVMFEEFLARVEEIEPVGEPERVFTNSTGGFKRFPVRMRVKPKA